MTHFSPITRFLRPALTTSLRALLAGALALPGVLRASESDEIRQLREQIRALEQKLDALERRQAQRDAESEAAAAAAKNAPKVSVTDRGFSLASADGANVIRLRGLVQADSRVFFDDGGLVNNTFVLRRARIISEGTFGRIFDFQLVPEFGGSSVSILDANVNIALSPQVQLKFGRFKAPVGLELLQPDSASFFVERSLVTNLVPNRDLGAQLGGSFLGGTVSYSLGAFNGVADGASTTNADFDNEKDAIGRVFVQPFKQVAAAPLQGLWLGIAASSGREKTAAALTGGYKTDGQQTFFKYKTTTIADGRSWRVSPQASYYLGPFGAMGEYVVSTVNVRSAATSPKTELRHKAWQLSSGYVLTGEKASYSGVVPGRPFSLDNGDWGAWEVTARYADLKIDDRAFPLLADPTANASGAAAWGVGVNWYLTRTVRATLDYFQTSFDTTLPAASVSPLLRQDEKALITRLQLAF